MCIALGVVFASGTLLMFSPELKHFRHSELWIAPSDTRVTVGQIFDSTLAEFPASKIESIGSQPRRWFGRPVYLTGESGAITAHLSPYTAEVLGTQRIGKLNLRNLLRKLHDSFLVPVQGIQVLVNTLSLVVLGLVITGLLVYRKFWKGFFKKPPANASQLVQHSYLHRRLAVWAAPFLIVSTLASTIFLLNAIGFKAKAGPSPTVTTPRPTALPDEFNGEALDALVSACKAVSPGFTETGIRIPNSGNAWVRIIGHDENRGEIFGAASCFTNPQTGMVEGFVKASEGNLMTQIKALAVAMHFGTFAGWFSIILWTIFGTVSTSVAISGAKLYATRVVAKASSAHSPPTSQSTLPLLIKGLGLFRWIYLAWAIGAIALLIIR